MFAELPVVWQQSLPPTSNILWVSYCSSFHLDTVSVRIVWDVEENPWRFLSKQCIWIFRWFLVSRTLENTIFVLNCSKKILEKKTAKLGIFLQNILWESCLKCDFEQLSHSMSVRNIARLAVAKETHFP